MILYWSVGYGEVFCCGCVDPTRMHSRAFHSLLLVMPTQPSAAGDAVPQLLGNVCLTGAYIPASPRVSEQSLGKRQNHSVGKSTGKKERISW